MYLHLPRALRRPSPHTCVSDCCLKPLRHHQRLLVHFLEVAAEAHLPRCSMETLRGFLRPRVHGQHSGCRHMGFQNGRGLPIDQCYSRVRTRQHRFCHVALFVLQLPKGGNKHRLVFFAVFLRVRSHYWCQVLGALPCHAAPPLACLIACL